MCTLSWLRAEQDFHLFFNRDELLSRRPELAPQHFHLNGQHILAPLDGNGSNSHSTWLGMSAQGLLLCLLNYYPSAGAGAAPGASYRSRGELIPRLLSEPEALRSAIRSSSSPFAGFALEDYPPFTLVCFDLGNHLGDNKDDGGDVAMYRWTGQLEQLGKLGELELSAKAPAMLTSSSYRSAEVEAQRRALFTLWRSSASVDSPLDFHRAFHSSHAVQYGQPECEGSSHSVCLHRTQGKPGKTVSFCHIGFSRGEERLKGRSKGRFDLRYFPGSPCQQDLSGPTTTFTLNLT